MSQPGWYPRPDGPPRYWDGSRWHDAEPRRGSAAVGWVIGGLLLIATIVLVLVLQPSAVRNLAGGGAPEDTRSDKPTVQPWDERSAPPEEPGEEDDGGMTPQECPNVGMPYSDVAGDGRMHAGGVSIVAPMEPGWAASTTYMPWMAEQNSRTRGIVDGWVASVDVGTVREVDGFRTPKQSAKAMVSCMASSWMYDGYTGHEFLVDEAFSLDGSSGWHVKVNVYVDRFDGIRGDVLDVVILDIGRDGELSVVVGCATIDHADSIREVDQALATMRVD